MGLETTTILAIAAASSAAAATGQAVIANKAAGVQEEQAQAVAAGEKQQRTEEKRRDFRKRRIARARIKQSAENTGVAGSTAAIGAVASLSTQGAAARGSQTAQASFSQFIGKRQAQLGRLNSISGAVGAANQFVQGAASLGIQANALEAGKEDAPKAKIPPK